MINNRYKIVTELGTGGMGIVYLVEDTLRDNMRFALKTIKQKVLSKARDKGIKSFKNEYDIMTRLKHPNLAQVYEFEEDKDNYFIIMEYLKGTLLSDYFTHNAIEKDQLLSIIIQVLRALNYIHSRNIVYRDIKPGNIMITDDKVKLLDFGLSGFFNEKDDRVKGTLLYMSPETISRNIEFSSDIFSLGIVFYELLAGQTFYHAESHDIRRIIDLLKDKNEFDSFKEDNLNKIKDKEEYSIIKKMTAYDPASRFQNCNEVIDAINAVFHKKYPYETDETKTSYVLGNTFANRVDELSYLKSVLKQKESMKKKPMIIYSGPMGAGKTRLFQEFKKYCRLNSVYFFEGNCIETGPIDYYSIIEVLSMILSYCSDTLIFEYAPYLKYLMPDNNKLYQYTPLADIDDPKALKDIIILNISDFLFKFSGENDKQVILYFNDIQWMDDGSAEILNHLIYRIFSHNEHNKDLFILANLNDDKKKDRSILNALLEHAEIKGIPPFNTQSVYEYIENVFGKQLLDKSIKDSMGRIRNIAGGNPLYLENFLKSLIERDIIIKKNKYWCLSKNIEDSDIPVNLKDLIRQRIETIMTDNIIKIFLEILSLLRIDPDFKTISLISQRIEITEIASLLQLLERNEILRSCKIDNSLRYSFINNIMKDIIRDKIKNKKGFSILLAETLEQISEDYNIEEIAYHYHMGDYYPKAIFYYMKASNNAYKNYFNNKAINYYDIILSIAEDIDLKLEVLEKKATALDDISLWNKAIEVLRYSIELAEKHNRPIMQGRSQNILGNILLLKGNTKEAKQLYDNSLEISKKTGDKYLLAKTFLQLGSYYYNNSLFDDAIDFYERSRSIFEEIDSKKDYAIALGNIGNIHYMKAQYKKAIENHKKFMDLSAEIGNKRGMAKAMGNIGASYAMLSCFDEAFYYLNNNIKTSKEIGDKRGYALAENNIGIIYLKQNKIHEALRHFENSREIFKEIDYLEGIGKVTGNIGIIYFRMGNYKKSLKYYNKYKDIAEKLGDKIAYAIAAGNIGNIFYNLGEFQKAIEYYKLKEDISKEIKDKRGLGIALWSQANVYFLMNEYKRSINLYEKSIDLLKEIEIETPFLIEYLINKTEILFSRNNYKEAIIVNEEVLKLSQNHIDKEKRLKILVQKHKLNAINEKESSVKALIDLSETDISDIMKADIYFEIYMINKEIKYKKKAIDFYEKEYNEVPDYHYINRIKILKGLA